MEDFGIYFRLGVDHITTLKGIDHIIFLIALCALYELASYKPLLLIVLSFTVGHSITLALAVLDIIPVNTTLIEFLIPVTILFAAIFNLFQKKDQAPPGMNYSRYVMGFVFGLIHGLGFSGYLKNLLLESTGIAGPLFAFNVGIEVGQLIIVIFILFLNMLFLQLIKGKKREWNLALSGAAAGIAILLIIQSEFFKTWIRDPSEVF